MKLKFKIRVVVAALLLAWPQHAGAQDCWATKSPKAQRMVENARNYWEQYPQRAQKQLEDALMIEGTIGEAHYLLAEIDMQQYERIKVFEGRNEETSKLLADAEKHYKFTLKFCKAHHDFAAYFKLAALYYETKRRDDALAMLKEYENKTTQNTFSDSAKWYRESIETYQRLIANPVPFSPTPIRNVCSLDDEYLPSLSPDGTMLFFTRRMKKQVLQGSQYLRELFMRSTLNAKGEYSAAEALPLPFNDGTNQGSPSLTIDNRTMYFTICSNVITDGTSYKNCDIYVTQFKNGVWTEPRALDEPVNGRYTFEAQPSISADGRTLYFVSIRDRGMGGMDIYKTQLQDNGRWTIPENLGPNINSSRDDKTPFLHTDGQTLYFASDGRHGMGGYDIYYSRLANGQWPKANNIGYPINTDDDELGLIASLNGESFIFSSARMNGNNQLDLYQAMLPKEAKPQPVVFVKGGLSSTPDNRTSLVSIENLRTGEVREGFSENGNGNYAISINDPKNDDFVVSVEKPGHMFQTSYIKPNNSATRTIIEHNFNLPELQKGMKVELENIYFEFNSSAFNYKSRRTLEVFVRFLNQHPKYNVGIYGHTDNVGNDAYNQQLSEQRAKAVYDYLVEHNIDRNRLKFKGFGESSPRADNSTESGRALNRRTEIQLL